MRRRVFLRLGASAVALFFAAGHTPYGQWTVFRKRHLLVGTSRTDVPTYDLGQKIAALLFRYLPESKARVSRAPDQWRLASLISTHQLDLVLLSSEDAVSLAEGGDPFGDFGGVALNGLFRFGDYLLICRPDFPDRHAYLVSRTLSEHGGAIPGAQSMTDEYPAIPVHPGALAFAEGHPLPSGEEIVEAETDSEDHVH